MSASRSIQLAGSLGMPTEAECFWMASAIAGPALKRLPDGEVGPRSAWIGWQTEKIAANPFLVLEPRGPGATEYNQRRRFMPNRGVAPGAVRFDDLGYAEAAIRSYAIYAMMKDKGELGARTRFQVSLPTPLAVLSSFIAAPYQAAIEPALKEGFLRELARILRAIPHDQLALQWDVAVEFGILEVGMPFHADNPKTAILERLAELGDAVPEPVELGYHLCYGNLGHKHFKEPDDTGLLVEIANGLFDEVDRSIDWIHLPVPIERDDAAYFKPLKDLRRPSRTEVFLGLLHLPDGLEGARRRMAAAAPFIDNFGVAAECGLANRSQGWTQSMLVLHREAAKLSMT